MFFCKASNSSFTAKSSIVNKHDFISKNNKSRSVDQIGEKTNHRFNLRLIAGERKPSTIKSTKVIDSCIITAVLESI